MNSNSILREITSEADIASYEGGGGICDHYSGWGRAYCEATQAMQCGVTWGRLSLDCGGCDPNGPYGGSGSSGSPAPTFHC